MAAEYMNDSYARCLGELRDRYKNRGASVNAQNEAAEQSKREAASRALASGSYVLFDADSKIADRYRSGEYNGSKYMTSDDFVRYFKTRRAFYSPQLSKEELPAEQQAAVPERRRFGSAGQSPLKADSGKEGHLANALSAVKVLADKWFPVERKEGRENGVRFRIPAAAMCGVAVFAVSLGLIVSGSVMLGNASGEVGELNSTIASLEAQRNELQGKLDLKYNVQDIEKEAKSLGMIKRQYADNEYITVNGEEQIIVYEDGEEKTVGLSALLASFGIELD